jgi:hypothetical protein
VDSARDCPGSDEVNLATVLLSIVECWPLGFFSGEVGTMVVGDADGICHNRCNSSLY